MKIIVTGGRHSRERDLVWNWLSDFYCELKESDASAELTVVQGGASGVDKHARDWCMQYGVPFVNYPYPRDMGRAGGPIRNRQMAEKERPDRVVAFPGGRGTASMVRIARELGIPVTEVRGDGSERSDKVEPTLELE